MFEASAFARNLRSARKRKGLSQRQLADQLFLCAQAVSKWEKGESLPDVPRQREHGGSAGEWRGCHR